MFLRGPTNQALALYELLGAHAISIAFADGAAQAVITVSTVLYIEWGRLGEIGDLYIVPEYRRRGLARCDVHGSSQA